MVYKEPGEHFEACVGVAIGVVLSWPHPQEVILAAKILIYGPIGPKFDMDSK